MEFLRNGANLHWFAIENGNIVRIKLPSLPTQLVSWKFTKIPNHAQVDILSAAISNPIITGCRSWRPGPCGISEYGSSCRFCACSAAGSSSNKNAAACRTRILCGASDSCCACKTCRTAGTRCGPTRPLPRAAADGKDPGNCLAAILLGSGRSYGVVASCSLKVEVICWVTTEVCLVAWSRNEVVYIRL